MDNPFAQLPIEIVWSMLLNMSYLDIMNFCRAKIHDVLEICDSNEFWLDKLDKDYTVYLSDKTTLMPSPYIIKYRKHLETGRTCYERWVRMLTIYTYHIGKTITISPYIIDNFNLNTDVIMFELDQDHYDRHMITFLQTQVPRKGNIDLLKKLLQLGSLRTSDLPYIALEYEQTHVLDWMLENGIQIPLTNTDVELALEDGKLKAVTWLIDHGYDTKL